MRHLLGAYFEGQLSRRAFLQQLVAAGFTASAASSLVRAAESGEQLFNAHRHGSALVVTAGMVDTTIYSDDLPLAPAPGFSQIETARQFTKISWEVREAASTALAVRRAYKVASSTPGGPVYAAFSRQVFEDPVEGHVWPGEKFLIEARPKPDSDKVETLARMLIEADRPIIFYGDEIWRSGAQAEAVELAELLGLAVAAGSFQAFSNFPVKQPQFIGRFQPEGPYPFGGADLVVQFGTRDPGGSSFPSRPPPDCSAFVAVGIDTNMLGRTQPMDLAVVGDVRETARLLVDAVKSLVTSERIQKIRERRLARVIPAVAERESKLTDEARKNFDRSPIHPDRMDYELERAADANAIVVEENFTGRHEFLRFGYRPDEKLRLTKAGSLGWGVGAAIGARMGAPDRQVILSIGDGAVMYGAAGFWTMARYEVPVLTVVCNNHNYQTVLRAFHDYNAAWRRPDATTACTSETPRSTSWGSRRARG